MPKNTSSIPFGHKVVRLTLPIGYHRKLREISGFDQMTMTGWVRRLVTEEILRRETGLRGSGPRRA